MTINLLLFAPIIQLNLLWVETIHFKFAQFIVPVSALTLRFCNIYFVLCANFLKRKVNIWKPQIPDKIKDKSLTGFLGKKSHDVSAIINPCLYNTLVDFGEDEKLS